MSYLQTLRDAQTRRDVANILDSTPSQLAYILFKIPDALKYTSFEIPKRSGEMRQIKAPVRRLRLLQRRLARVLYVCLDEIEKSGGGRRSLAHGFERKRSIVTNASLHKRRRYVLNLDLEEFFPSFSFGRVRGFFIKDKHFGLNEDVATVIAQIACHENQLPQGSPCSPVISNLIGHCSTCGSRILPSHTNAPTLGMLTTLPSPPVERSSLLKSQWGSRRHRRDGSSVRHS